MRDIRKEKLPEEDVAQGEARSQVERMALRAEKRPGDWATITRPAELGPPLAVWTEGEEGLEGKEKRLEAREGCMGLPPSQHTSYQGDKGVIEGKLPRGSNKAHRLNKKEDHMMDTATDNEGNPSTRQVPLRPTSHAPIEVIPETHLN